MPLEKPSVLYTQAVIAERVRELGREITEAYKDAVLPVVAVPVLDGAGVFAADLLREVKLDLIWAPVTVQTYEGRAAKTTPKVLPSARMRNMVSDSVHVLIIEDIIDVGHTMAAVVRYVQRRFDVVSTQYATLLDKNTGKDLRVAPGCDGFTGFSCPDKFVVGYGLDLDGYYRNLPYVGVLGGS